MKPFKVYMGYDPIDDRAFRACSHSLQKHASIPVDIIPVWDRPLRQAEIYWRTYHTEPSGQMVDDIDQKPFSSAFSFARFAVPIMEDYQPGLVLFCDPDMLWRADIADLLDDTYAKKAVWCVHHKHKPPEKEKMYGCVQSNYARKNWSSFMLMNPAACREMTAYKLNTWPGGELHAFHWLKKGQIGELHHSWNWLEGWNTDFSEPKVVHFTRGTPDMKGHEDVPYAHEWWDAYREALTGEAEELSEPLAKAG